MRKVTEEEFYSFLLNFKGDYNFESESDQYYNYEGYWDDMDDLIAMATYSPYKETTFEIFWDY